MATERARLIELSMIRYRDDHDSEYIYFWIEKFNNEMVSPVYESEEDAMKWYKDICGKMNNESQNWKIQKLDRTTSDRR